METASICHPKKRRLHETTPQVSVARQKVSDVCFIIQQIETDIPGVAYEDVSEDETVPGGLSVWDATRGVKLFENAVPYYDYISDAALSIASSRLVVINSMEEMMSCWNLLSGKLEYEVNVSECAQNASFVFNSAGSKVLSFGEHALINWDAENGSEIWRSLSPCSHMAANYVVIDGMERVISLSESGTIRVYDAERKIRLWKFAGATYNVHPSHVDYGIDIYAILAVGTHSTQCCGCLNGMLYVWNYFLGTTVFAKKSRVLDFILGPHDLTVIAVVIDYGDSVKIWDLGSSSLLHEYRADNYRISKLIGPRLGCCSIYAVSEHRDGCVLCELDICSGTVVMHHTKYKRYVAAAART
jgi:WD40 repeat protein